MNAVHEAENAAGASAKARSKAETTTRLQSLMQYQTVRDRCQANPEVTFCLLNTVMALVQDVENMFTQEVFFRCYA